MGEVSRRDFLNSLGVTVGAAVAASAGAVTKPVQAEADEPPKGNIPEKLYRVGHMTFFSGPAAVLGEPSYKGHILAAEEINAQGGLLGKRKIETLKADENAGTDDGQGEGHGRPRETRRIAAHLNPDSCLATSR